MPAREELSVPKGDLPAAGGPLVRTRQRDHGVSNRYGLQAILFDRDGTLVADVPYNGDPSRVRLLPTVAAALVAVGAAGLASGVVTNQSGIGRGLLTEADAHAVADRVEELLGGFDVWVMCPHVPAERCDCRKPEPGGLLTACAVLGVSPHRVGYVGDIGSDVLAAQAAGVRPVLVPTAVTRQEEIDAAPLTAPDLISAVRLLLA